MILWFRHSLTRARSFPKATSSMLMTIPQFSPPYVFLARRPLLPLKSPTITSLTCPTVHGALIAWHPEGPILSTGLPRPSRSDPTLCLLQITVFFGALTTLCSPQFLSPDSTLQGPCFAQLWMRRALSRMQWLASLGSSEILGTLNLCTAATKKELSDLSLRKPSRPPAERVSLAARSCLRWFLRLPPWVNPNQTALQRMLCRSSRICSAATSQPSKPISMLRSLSTSRL